MSNYKKQALDYMLNCCTKAGLLTIGKLKGAYTLNMYLDQYGKLDGVVDRQTSDLDFDLYGELDQQKLIDSVVSLIEQDTRFKCTKKRISNPASMGVVFSVDTPDGLLKLKIDFANVGSSGKTGIATLEEMLLDKIKVNSDQKLERRSKDAFDLYINNMAFLPQGYRLNDLCKMYNEKYGRLDLSNSLYATYDGISRLNHAMSKYTPNPVSGVSITAIIASNQSFLAAFEMAQRGSEVLKVDLVSWRIV